MDASDGWETLPIKDIIAHCHAHLTYPMLKNVMLLMSTCQSLRVKGDEHVVECIGYSSGGDLRFSKCGLSKITTTNPYLVRAQCGICKMVNGRKGWSNKGKEISYCTICKDMNYVVAIPVPSGYHFEFERFCIDCYMCSSCYSRDRLALVSYRIKDDLYYSSPEQRMRPYIRYSDDKLYCYTCRKYPYKPVL